MKPDPLTSSQNERLRQGLELFNDGRFFECHEVLESVWLEASGEDKVFLQGLIQVAVSFYHLRRGNLIGSGRLLRAALQKMASPSQCRKLIDTASLLETLQPLPERIDAGQASPATPAPEIHWMSAP